MGTCAVFKLDNIIGKKWTMVIVQELAINNGMGFNNLLKTMQKISPKVLSKRIQELEKEGIVKKESVGIKGKERTLYKLTKKGKDLNIIFDKIRIWCTENKTPLSSKRCTTCPMY